MANPKQTASAAAAEAQAVDLGEFSDLLEKDFRVKEDDSAKLQKLNVKLNIKLSTWKIVPNTVWNIVPSVWNVKDRWNALPELNVPECKLIIQNTGLE